MQEADSPAAKQLAENSAVLKRRSFSYAVLVPIMLAIPSRLQPARDLLFRVFQQTFYRRQQLRFSTFSAACKVAW